MGHNPSTAGKEKPLPAAPRLQRGTALYFNLGDASGVVTAREFVQS